MGDFGSGKHRSAIYLLKTSSSFPQKAWTALVGEGLELFQGANFQINGVDCAWSPDDGRLGDSGCALIFDDSDKKFIISKLA